MQLIVKWSSLFFCMVAYSYNDIKIEDYKTLKEEFKKTLKGDLETSVNVLNKLATPELLKSVVSQNNFYRDIFDVLLMSSLMNKKISWIPDFIKMIPTLSERKQQIVAEKMANSFFKVFQDIEGVEQQKFALAIGLLNSDLGNKILIEWLKLDQQLPFVNGEHIIEHYEINKSNLNLMQYMLIEYSINIMGIKNIVVEKDTIEAYATAWQKGKKDKDYKAQLNFPAPDMSWAGLQLKHPTQGIFQGEYTVESLAKALHLSYFFEESTDNVTDQFARAVHNISLEA